jgi:hypothetical protein
MNTSTDNGLAVDGLGAAQQGGKAHRPRPLRIAVSLAAATPIAAAVFGFTPPVAAAVPVATAPATQASDLLSVDADLCLTAIQFTGLDTLKWPLCAAD